MSDKRQLIGLHYEKGRALVWFRELCRFENVAMYRNIIDDNRGAQRINTANTCIIVAALFRSKTVWFRFDDGGALSDCEICRL